VIQLGWNFAYNKNSRIPNLHLNVSPALKRNVEKRRRELCNLHLNILPTPDWMSCRSAPGACHRVRRGSIGEGVSRLFLFDQSRLERRSEDILCQSGGHGAWSRGEVLQACSLRGSAKSYSSPRCANISRAGFGSPGLGSFGAFFLPFFLFRWFFPDSVGFFLFYFQYFWIWANFAYILYLFNFFCSDSKFV
jgi:hypothetical protein